MNEVGFQGAKGSGGKHSWEPSRQVAAPDILLGLLAVEQFCTQSVLVLLTWRDLSAPILTCLYALITADCLGVLLQHSLILSSEPQVLSGSPH